MTRKIKVTKVRVAAVIVTALIVITGVVALHFLALGSILKLADLIPENEQNTTYLRPKQWLQKGTGATTTFTDAAGQGKASAVVGLQLGPSPLPSSLLNNPSLMRSTALNLVTATEVEHVFETATGQGCNPGNTLVTSADTSVNGNTTGLYNLAAACTTVHNDNVLHMHSVVGKDGYVRTLILIAKQTAWNNNQTAFKAMLASVKQSNKPTDTQTRHL